MRRLTNMQIDHLTSRIDSVINTLSNQEVAKLGPIPVVTEYTTNEKLAMIRSGKAKLRNDINSFEGYGSYSLWNYFMFPDNPSMRKSREAHEHYVEKRKAIFDEFGKTKQRLRDEAILGDSIEAMQMLQALERKLPKN